MDLRHASLRIAVAGLVLAATSPAAAQDEGWDFRVAPYVILPSMDGDVVLRGREAELDVGPDDIFSHLNMGFQGYFEASNGAMGFALDVVYMDLDATDDDRLAEVDATQSAVTPMVFARVAPQLDFYVGARFNSIGGDADFQGPLGLQTVEQDKSWIDPLVGVRFAAPIGEKWNFEISGDVGGFGVGSDLAVNVWPMVGYEISDNAQLAFGYRILYTDYDSGTGAELFAYDVLTMGPVIGAVIGF
jgi:hypothetical protein